MRGTSTGKVRFLIGVAVGGALATIASPRAASAAWCGVTVTTDGATITLNANETCAGDGLTIQADNVTVEGQGHVITGSGAHNGVYITNAKGVAVKNVTIKNFNKGARFEGTGGTLSESNLLESAVLENNVAYGIEFAAGTKGNLARYVIVRNNGDEGVHFGTGGTSNVLGNSSIYNNAHEQVYVQTNVGGCTNVNNQHVVQFNCISGGTQTLKVDRSQGNYFRGNVFRGSYLEFTGGAKDNHFGQDGGTACTSDSQCGTSNGDAVCPTTGKCVLGTCWGNLIDGTFLQFDHRAPDGGDGTVLPANTNTVAHLQVINRATSDVCVEFKGTLGAPLPYSNLIRDSKFSCQGSAFDLSHVTGDTSGGPQNVVCQSDCGAVACNNGDGSANGGSQSNDDLDIITISSACP